MTEMQQPWADSDFLDASAVEMTVIPPVTPTTLAAVLNEPLSLDEARELTERIRSAADVLWVLIARAHAGRAWEALGYSSFEGYVNEEFDISRSRGYQLLNQARVVQAIEAATPDGTRLHLTEAAARDLRGVIDEVVPEIERRTHGMAPDEAGDVVEEIVSDYRDRVQETRAQRRADDEDSTDEHAAGEARPVGAGQGGTYTPPAPVPPVYNDDDDIDPAVIRRNVQAAYDLYSSLSALQSMPDQDDVINTIPVERRMQVNTSLRASSEWLAEFTRRWEGQPWHHDDTDEDTQPDGAEVDEGDFIPYEEPAQAPHLAVVGSD